MLVGIQSIPASSVYVEGKLREPMCIYGVFSLAALGEMLRKDYK